MSKALQKTMPRSAPKEFHRAVPKVVPPPPARDENIAGYIIGIVVLLLIMAFALAWFIQDRSEKFRPNVSYASIGPLQLSYQGYSLSTKMAIRTDTEDAGWAAKNKQAMELVLQNTLAQSDPKEMLGTNNIGRLQLALKDDINKAFKTGKVREVILTDFVFASDN